MSIAINIKTWRAERGLSQARLAAISGLDRDALVDIEDGVRAPDSTELAFLSDALGVAPSRLRDDQPEILYRHGSPTMPAGQAAVDWFARYVEDSARLRLVAEDLNRAE